MVTPTIEWIWVGRSGWDTERSTVDEYLSFLWADGETHTGANTIHWPRDLLQSDDGITDSSHVISMLHVLDGSEHYLSCSSCSPPAHHQDLALSWHILQWGCCAYCSGASMSPCLTPVIISTAPDTLPYTLATPPVPWCSKRWMQT